MSLKPLNFYQQWAVAGMQQDQYSQAPWFVDSKNLDIFSSSQSVKATAWKDGVKKDANLVDIDPTGRFELHKNARVWDNTKSKYITGASLHIWAIKKVKYNEWVVDMTIGSPLALFVEWGLDDRETIVVITTNLIYTKINRSRLPKIKIKDIVWGKLNPDGSISGDGTKKYIEFKLVYDDIPWYYDGSEFLLKKQLKDWNVEYWDVSIDRIHAYHPSLVYNEDIDELIPDSVSVVDCIAKGKTSTTDWQKWENDQIEVIGTRTYSDGVSESWCVKVRVNIVNPKNDKQFDWKIIVENREEINSYTNFLAKIKDQKIKKEWENYIINGYTLSKIYQFAKEYNSDWSLKRIEFLQQQSLPHYLGLEVVDVVASDDQIYRFGNKRGDWILSRFPLIAGSEWEHITYPWIVFVGAVRVNNIIYCVAKNRGIGTLYGFNWSEFLPIISWKIRDTEKDLIGSLDSYNFKFITEWRGTLILWTKDEVFAYGNTFGGKGFSSILQLEEGTITNIKISEWNLEVYYFVNGEIKRKIYQDDMTIKNYNSEFEIVYPVVLGDHSIEKEAQDIIVSYLLPSKKCSIEVWASGNHYHYRSFKMESEIEGITEWDQYTLQGCNGEYVLSFVEKNELRYTFELQGDLPYQRSNAKSIKNNEGTIFKYLDFHHFRKVGEITASWFKEWIERFTNINNLLNFPITHSFQVMIKGKGTKNYSPELFWVHLSARQRAR